MALNSNWILSLDDLVVATHGQVLARGKETFTEGVATDTRANLQDKIFFALRGGQFDAHDFLVQAVRGGASCLVVDRDVDLTGLSGVSVVKVSDTLEALQALARTWRKRLKAQVLGITGSNGKTTTKEFAATIIGSKLKTHFSKGSFNNHWGVPLTILGAPLNTEVLVLEMGMNHLHEIEKLVKMAEPDVVVCTMVGQSHIGELGSQENIARAKSEIYFTQPVRTQIFNQDNEWTMAMWEKALKLGQAQTLTTFSSFSDQATVKMRAESMKGLKLSLSGVIQGVAGRAEIPVFGRHNVTNLMAAASLALAAGLSPQEIWAALPQCRSSWGRNEVLTSSQGATILFDAYNANPESMAMVLRNLLEIDTEGRRVVVLGEMLELGALADKAHRELGELVARADFDLVWFMGPHASQFEIGLKTSGFGKTFYKSNTYEESLAHSIGSMLDQHDVVVIKGSRGMKLERVLDAWGVPMSPKP